MLDVMVYAVLIGIGYTLGSITGWIAGVNNLSLKKQVKNINANIKADPKLCEDYSHLKNSPAAMKSMYERSLKRINNKDLYEKVYDADIVDDEYKVNKVI